MMLAQATPIMGKRKLSKFPLTLRDLRVLFKSNAKNIVHYAEN